MKKIQMVKIIMLMFTLMFCSCILPENFECSLFINKDGSSGYNFVGTVVDTEILAEIKDKNNNVTRADEDSYREYMDQILDNDSFTNYRYEGKGRARVEFSDTVINEDLSVGIMYQWFGIVREQGIVKFVFEQADADSLAQLNDLDFKMKGEITLTSELPVIDSAGYKVQNKRGKYIIKLKVDSIPQEPLVITFQA